MNIPQSIRYIKLTKIQCLCGCVSAVYGNPRGVQIMMIVATISTPNPDQTHRSLRMNPIRGVIKPVISSAIRKEKAAMSRSGFELGPPLAAIGMNVVKAIIDK